MKYLLLFSLLLSSVQTPASAEGFSHLTNVSPFLVQQREVVEVGITLAELAVAARSWVAAGLRAGVVSMPAGHFFGQTGYYTGMTAEWVAQNFEAISAGLQHMRFGLTAAAPAGRFVVGRLAACAPQILLAVVIAGLIPPAIFQARLRALGAEGLNNARIWQLGPEREYSNRRRTRTENSIRLPAFVDTTDILVEGPSASEVSEEAIQLYIRNAFVARNVPTAENTERALTTLRLIIRAATANR